jgi:hypothetical protein
MQMSKSKNLIYVGIIILISILIAIPLFDTEFNIYIGEGIQHIARSYAANQNGIFAKVIPSFANSYGYSWNLFSGGLANTCLTLLSFIIKNFCIAYKIFVVIIFALSGISMYKLVEKISDNKNMAVLSAGLYMMIPYHLTTIFVRNALAEQIAIALIPFVFLGIYYILNNSEKHYYYALGLTLLFFADTSLAWITLVISILYFIFNLKCLKNRDIVSKIILDIGFVIILTASFWLPYLETNIMAEYKFNVITEADKENFVSQAISLRKIFVTAKSETYPFEIGPLLIAILALTPIAISSIKKDFRKDYLFYFVFCIIGFWVATKYFPWSAMPNFVVKLGSPWRLLVFANFFLVLVCSLNVGAIINNLKLREVLILIIVSFVYILFLQGYIQKSSNITNIEDLSLGTISGKESEISAGINASEFLTLNAYSDKFYIATRDQKLYVLEGKAVIENEKKDGTSFSANVKTYNEKETKFELPYIYYPGYSIKADGVPLEAYETENGFLGFTLNENDSVKIEVEYTGTDMQRMGTAISIISGLIFAICFIKNILAKDEEVNNEISIDAVAK